MLQTPSFSPDITAELLRISRTTKSHLKPDPHNHLESLDIEDLQRHIAGQTPLLHAALGDWDDRRNRGWRKGRTRAQTFVVSFDRFLKAFSGILEIARLADEQYGGAATRIFSLLWATVKIKADNDEAIVSVMENINDRLPDVDIYNQVYVDSVLGTMIATAFRDVLLFSQQATLYFQGRGMSRAIKSISNPVRFPDLQEQLVKDFNNIRHRCDALLAQRISELSNQNAELLLQMKTMTENQHAERVRKLQKALGRHHSESKAHRDLDLAEYRHFLFSLLSSAPVELSRLSGPELEQIPEYTRWAASRSSLLFLHGRNSESWPMPQSWLSLAAVDLVEHLRASEAKPLVVFHRCGPEDAMEDVLKEMISQLLDLEPSVVKDADDMRDLEARISAGDQDGVPLYRREEGRDLMDEYAGALTRIVERCPRAVYLFVNRPELCAGERMWSFVKALLRLVEEETQVKVVLVVRTELWNIESRLCDLDQGLLDPDSSKLVVLRRNQHELDLDKRYWQEDTRELVSEEGR
ncbi:hypothetical protein QBC39DRAFT_415460 [Podospora conica]|nr:hypothetical protein QBC39DRAFT_415460 [Schizothecium conicum]